MRAQGVVVGRPIGEQVAHRAQGDKEVSIEYFAAKRGVESLRIGGLGGFARLNPVQDDVLGRLPVAQRDADKFGPVVAAQLCGPAVLLDQLGQQAHHAASRPEKKSLPYRVPGG